MNKFLPIAFVALAGLPGGVTPVVAGDVIKLCDPVTPDSACDVVATYPSMVIRDECGFSEQCPSYGDFAEPPWMDCKIDTGEARCEAWPQTPHGAESAAIRYHWSTTGVLAQPEVRDDYTPVLEVTCEGRTGTGRVIVDMLPPGGHRWTRLEQSIDCRLSASASATHLPDPTLPGPSIPDTQSLD
jgi:hypothetical protein